MLTSEMIVQVAPNQISSDISQESIILNLTNGCYYSLNDVGTRIWHLMQRPASVEQITAILHEEYDVSWNDCRQCVLDLLQDLDQHGLIEVQHESGA